MAARQKADLPTVQKTVQQVAEKLRDENGSDQPGQSSECGFHAAEIRRVWPREQATRPVRHGLSEDAVDCLRQSRNQGFKFRVSGFEMRWGRNGCGDCFPHNSVVVA